MHESSRFDIVYLGPYAAKYLNTPASVLKVAHHIQQINVNSCMFLLSHQNLLTYHIHSKTVKTKILNYHLTKLTIFLDIIHRPSFIKKQGLLNVMF
jgi:hypothetical protein